MTTATVSRMALSIKMIIRPLINEIKKIMQATFISMETGTCVIYIAAIACSGNLDYFARYFFLFFFLRSFFYQKIDTNNFYPRTSNVMIREDVKSSYSTSRKTQNKYVAAKFLVYL